MNYYSINRQSPTVDFKQATLNGLAPDKGLYFPEAIPMLDKGLVTNIEKYSNEEVAFRVIEPFIGNAIPAAKLFRIVQETVNFPIPLVRVYEDIFSLELYHGNTLAFKDIGARFMSRCLGHFVEGIGRKVIVLVATSGDTGGAVADGFFNVEGVEVVILYPSGKVSEVQEKQLTTYGGNIHAVEVNGNFDDCQALVKKAFSDRDLNDRLFLTSANSINVARWLPQQFFYFFAYKQWEDKSNPPVMSIPSGNLGNLCAGLLAKKTGLPIGHLIAACNANDAVPKFFNSGHYAPQPTIATISNAMDVGDPSNFARIMEIFSGDAVGLKNMLTAFSISEAETKASIKDLFLSYGYVADPHGAVGYAALKKYLDQYNQTKGIFLETAHPVKFYDVVEPLLDTQLERPASVQKIMSRAKMAKRVDADYEEIRRLILSLH